MSLKKYLITFVAVSILCIQACKPPDLGPGEYLKWVEMPAHGLVKEKKIGGINFQAQYKPYEYVVLKESGLNPVTPEGMKAQLNQMGDLTYFTLRMQTTDGSDPLKYQVTSKEAYYARIKYLSFDVQNDVKLVSGKDTLKCVIAAYDRSYGLKPEITVMTGFLLKQKKSMDDFQFIFNDKIFNSGPVMLSFESSALSKLPNLML